MTSWATDSPPAARSRVSTQNAKLGFFQAAGASTAQPNNSHNSMQARYSRWCNTMIGKLRPSWNLWQGAKQEKTLMLRLARHAACRCWCSGHSGGCKRKVHEAPCGRRIHLQRRLYCPPFFQTTWVRPGMFAAFRASTALDTMLRGWCLLSEPSCHLFSATTRVSISALGTPANCCAF